MNYLFWLTVKINGSGETILHMMPPSSFAEHGKPASVDLHDGVPRRRWRRRRRETKSERSDGNVEFGRPPSLQQGRGGWRGARRRRRGNGKREHERFCGGRVNVVIVVVEREHWGSGNCHRTRHVNVSNCNDDDEASSLFFNLYLCMFLFG